MAEADMATTWLIGKSSEFGGVVVGVGDGEGVAVSVGAGVGSVISCAETGFISGKLSTFFSLMTLGVSSFGTIIVSGLAFTE